MTGPIFLDQQLSQSVRELVETVGRLGPDDQDRILRIVTLLAVAPARVQAATKRMLSELLKDDGITAGDCIAQVDEVIDYLEDNIDSVASRAATEAQVRLERQRLN